jgi:PAS domain S-box-containing protein
MEKDAAHWKRINLDLRSQIRILTSENQRLVRESRDLSDVKRQLESKNDDLEKVRLDLENSLAALRESEARFRSLVETTSDWTWEIDVHGKYTYSSPKVKELLGYEPREIIGRTPFDLMPAEEAKRIQTIFNTITAEKNAFFGLENQNLHRDGHIVWLETSGVPLLDAQKNLCGYRGIDRDVTDRINSEQALRESEERFRQLSEAAFEGIVIHEDGVVLRANDQFFKMFGYEPHELLEKQGHALTVAPESLDSVKERMASGSTEPYEFVGLRKDGTRMFLESRVKTMDYKGRKARVAAMRDVTARRQHEEELVAHRKKLRSLASELSLAEERERRRIAAEVHDHIGQNLAFAKIQLTALRAACPKELRESIDQITKLVDKSIQDVRALVSEIGLPVLYELGFVPAVEWLTQRIGKRHGIALGFKDDAKSKPLSDELQVLLFQSVRELLVNVAKHAQAKEALVSVSADSGKIIVEVVDQGIGFDTARSGSCYDDTAGFGLFSVQERLEPFGGTIAVSSRRGRGTRATVSAPLKQTSPETTRRGKKLNQGGF